MLSNPTDEAAWGSGKGPSLAALGLCLRVDYWIGRYRNERCETVSEFPVTSGQSPVLPPESGQAASARKSTG